MVNSGKINKKTSVNNKKTNLFYGRNKYEKIIVIVFVVALIGLLGIGAYVQYATNADKDNVIMMRGRVAAIAAELNGNKSNDNLQDGSYCSVIDAKAFGEKTEYFCTSFYYATVTVSDQGDVNAIVDSHLNVLSNDIDIEMDAVGHVTPPVYISNPIILDLPGYRKIDQVSGYGFKLKDVKRAKCSIKYELKNSLSGNEVDLAIALSCIIPTKKAYFEPIKQT